MGIPCVRAKREAGEQTRKQLAKRELLDQTHEIVNEDGFLFIPVSDPDAVPQKFEIVDREMPARETQTMPADLIEFPASYERLGDVVIIDEDDDDRARALADAIVESDLHAESVLNRASKIQGTERVRDWEQLVGETTEAVHREYGCTFRLDLAEVYFSPRLATERHRVIEQITDSEQIVDMFAGVGPFAIPAAKHGGTVLGVDINESAIEYLRENAEQNGVADNLKALHGDVRTVADEYENWADRLVMNLPHSANEFLDTAVKLASGNCLIHYYDIQHEDDPFGPGERAIREAATGYDVSVENRRIVRSYAPHEYNVVLDVRLSN